MKLQEVHDPGFGIRALARFGAVLAKARTPNFALVRAYSARTLALLAFFALRPETANACAVCFGKSDSAMAKGMNMGIFTLLICITGVLGMLSCFFVFLAVRSSKHPPADALEGSQNSPDNPANS